MFPESLVDGGFAMFPQTQVENLFDYGGDMVSGFGGLGYSFDGMGAEDLRGGIAIDAPSARVVSLADQYYDNSYSLGSPTPPAFSNPIPGLNTEYMADGTDRTLWEATTVKAGQAADWLSEKAGATYDAIERNFDQIAKVGTAYLNAQNNAADRQARVDIARINSASAGRAPLAPKLPGTVSGGSYAAIPAKGSPSNPAPRYGQPNATATATGPQVGAANVSDFFASTLGPVAKAVGGKNNLALIAGALMLLAYAGSKHHG